MFAMDSVPDPFCDEREWIHALHGPFFVMTTTAIGWRSFGTPTACCDWQPNNAALNRSDQLRLKRASENLTKANRGRGHARRALAVIARANE
jgi:hypothetical protein